MNRHVLAIADLSDVWVVASVPEKDVRFIHPNETVHVVVAAYPHGLFSGRMTYISDVLDHCGDHEDALALHCRALQLIMKHEVCSDGGTVVAHAPHSTM